MTDESSAGRPGRTLHRALLRLLRGGRTAGPGARATAATGKAVGGVESFSHMSPLLSYLS